MLEIVQESPERSKRSLVVLECISRGGVKPVTEHRAG